MGVISEDKVFLLFDDITTMIIQIINYNHHDHEPFSIFSVFNEKNVTASFGNRLSWLYVMNPPVRYFKPNLYKMYESRKI